MRRRILFVLLSAVLFSVVGAGSAGAAPPPGEPITRCGQTITGSTAYLTRDLTCTSGFSWIADPDTFDPGPDVTIDLRGHRLRGPGSGIAFLGSGDVIKTVSLTVTNGRVDHWERAFVVGFGGLTVAKVRIDHNGSAVTCEKGACDVTDSVIDHNGSGGDVLDGTLRFTRTQFLANDTGTFAGGSFSDVYVTDSTFAGNKVGVQAYPNGDSTVTGSVFTANGVGFRGVEGIYTTLTGNRFVGNRDGIFIDSAAPEDSLSVAELKDNVAHHNRRYGIYAPGATDLGGNRAWRNRYPCVGVVCTRS